MKPYAKLAVVALAAIFILYGCGGSDQPSTEPPRYIPTPGGTEAPTPDVKAVLGENVNAEEQASALMNVQERVQVETCPVKVGQDNFMVAEDVLAALPCVIDLYPWPEDRRVDLDLYQQLAFGEDIDEWRFPSDFLFSTADSLNECSWFEAWLYAVENGLEDQQEAAELMIVYVIPAYPETIPGYPIDLDTPDRDAFLIEIGKSVQLGDPSTLQKWMPGMCPFSPWVSPETTAILAPREDV